jgi:hypothetical protein
VGRRLRVATWTYPEVKMIPSNLNSYRFEILEIINRLERAQLSQSRIALASGGPGRPAERTAEAHDRSV